MRRRVELNKSHFINTTTTNRNVEDKIRDWSKIDTISREKQVKGRLLVEKLELQELERREREKETRARLIREQAAEKAKSDELIEQSRKSICDKKLRQKLREECEELRILEQQLRTAYVAKERAFQIGEKKTKQLQEKIRDERERQVLEERRLAALKEDEQKAIQTWKEKEQFRKTLQDQMTETFNRKRVRYEEFLREKVWIDEIASRLQEEQLQEVERKMRRIQEASQDIEEFRREKDRYNAKQKKATEEENQRISKYLHDKDIHDLREENERKEKLKHKTEITEKLTKHLEEIETETRHRRDLVVDLNIKELQEREELRLRQKLEEQLRRRVQVRLELEKQREFKWIRQQQEKEEERLYKEEQLRIMAENDRLELLSNEMKRRKQIEHRKAVEELLELRRQRRVQEMNEAKKRHDEELDEAQRIREMIEEERIKILKEHAQEVIGFLPIGILRQSDAQQLPLPTKDFPSK